MADDSTTPLRVVVLIQDAFLTRAGEDLRFGRKLEQSLYLLKPPDRDALRDALVVPAEMAGYRFETERMVQQIIDTLANTSGALPLLQFTASKLWGIRDTERRLLTEQSYHAIGGIVGVLASHADAAMNTLSAEELYIAARLILPRLVTPERTCAIVSIDELLPQVEPPAEIERLVHYLVDMRLLVVQRSDSDAGARVEIVHEALIDGWPMLRFWLEENQEQRTYLEQIRTTAEQWDSRGRPSGVLLRDGAADEAQRWYHGYRGQLTGVQHAYLTAVFALVATRRKRLLIARTVICLLLLALTAGVVLVLIRDAEQRAREQVILARAAEAATASRAEEALAAKQQIRRQLDELQEKERQRQEILRLAGDSSEQAATSVEQLRVINERLREALVEAESARSRVSKLLEEAERAKDEQIERRRYLEEALLRQRAAGPQ